MNVRSLDVAVTLSVLLIAAGCGTPDSPAGAADVEPAPEGLSDAAIASAVERELAHDTAVSVAELDVRVTEGVVELTGPVPHLLAKRRAVLIAEGVRGVLSVIDRTLVEPVPRGDPEIRADVEAALAADPVTEPYEVSVEVEDQTVTLTGEVRSWQEKESAGRAAEGVAGVREVRSLIEVTPVGERADAEILEDVESRLRWDTLVDDGLIEVAVADGHVLLSGAVGSAAERRRAVADAWVTGARSVDGAGIEVRWWADDEDLRDRKYVHRTDEEIDEALTLALLLDPRVALGNVEAEVEDGVVTLTGLVSNLRARRAAEQVARHTVGVARLVNRLLVEVPGMPSSADLEATIEAALARNSVTEAHEIEVEVKRSVATLRGQVQSAGEKAVAEDVAAGVPGIAEVHNVLTVADGGVGFVSNPFVYPYHPFLPPETRGWREGLKTDAEILEDVREELDWSPFVDEEQVQVTVDSGTVTLGGVVDTRRERDAAVENAYEGGAVIVEDQLEIGS